MLELVQAHSKAELVSLSNARIKESVQQGHSVSLIVPDTAWGNARRAQLAQIAPLGVSVETHGQLVTRLWELFGDGSRVIDPSRRRMLLRPLVQRVGLLEASPSIGLMDGLCSFVEEAVVAQADGVELNDSQRRLLELVEIYKGELSSHGFVELAEAEARLVDAPIAQDLVVENALMHKDHRSAFLENMGEKVEVTAIERSLLCNCPDPVSTAGLSTQSEELQKLRAALYTGTASLSSEGAFVADEARGMHVQGALLAERLQDRENYGSTCVVFPNAADSYPAIQKELARAEIPFVADFSLPVARTALGAAFIDLLQFSEHREEDSSYIPLVSFVASPYSGVDPKDVRALQMRWRETAGSTPQQRLADITQGFNRGNASSKVTRERLEPLTKLIELGYSDQVKVLFENARAAHVSGRVLTDDAKAADAVLDYLGLCEELGMTPELNEIASLSVSVTRACGDESVAVQLVGAGEIGLGEFDQVLVMGLDSAHFPMAAQAGPFDPMLEVLGLKDDDATALRQRVFLLDAIEAASSRVVACRPTHSAEGAELCQSALWDELMSAYRTDAEDEDGLPAHVIPAALRAGSLAVSEAEEFGRAAKFEPFVHEFTRGQVDRAEIEPYLAFDASGNPMPFSPTGIEDYYRCPYRWFTSRRVGYNGMDRAFDASAQGNLVHAVFERFYRDLHAQGVPRVTEENLAWALELAGAAFDEQVKRDRGRSKSGLFLKSERDEQVIEDIRKLVVEFVKREAEFLPGFAPTYLELSLGKGTGQVLEYAGVPVRGKVDRIDVDAEGNAVVIDYKLSSLAQGYGLRPELELPPRIQTDIYATLVQRHFDLIGEPIKVIGSVYRSYAHNRLRGVYDRGIEWGGTEKVDPNKDALPRSGSDETYSEYLEHVEDEVSKRMRELKAGNIAPNPTRDDTNVCEYCKALLFCPKAVM